MPLKSNWKPQLCHNFHGPKVPVGFRDRHDAQWILAHPIPPATNFHPIRPGDSVIQQYLSVEDALFRALKAIAPDTWRCLTLFRKSQANVATNSEPLPFVDILLESADTTFAKGLVQALYPILLSHQLHSAFGIDVRIGTIQPSAFEIPRYPTHNCSAVVRAPGIGYLHHTAYGADPVIGTGIGVYTCQREYDDSEVGRVIPRLSSGTLGPFLRLKETNGQPAKYYALTCHHVLVRDTEEPYIATNPINVDVPSLEDHKEWMREAEEEMQYYRPKPEYSSLDEEEILSFWPNADLAAHKEACRGFKEICSVLAHNNDEAARHFGSVAASSGLQRDLGERPQLDWALVEPSLDRFTDTDKMTTVPPLSAIDAASRAFTRSTRARSHNHLRAGLADTSKLRGKTGMLGRAYGKEKFVFKLGRSTGQTYGFVSEIHARKVIEYTIEGKKIKCTSTEAVVSNLPDLEYGVFSRHGDSGSAVWDAHGALVGMLFAGQEGNFAFVTPIQVILQDIALKLDVPLDNLEIV
ncbi:hypothetical protein CHU98_g12592 [Xylaria longipes]|nr:hypothetical protein CHU98_g12592 [Xylaria longipes]